MLPRLFTRIPKLQRQQHGVLLKGLNRGHYYSTTKIYKPDGTSHVVKEPLSPLGKHIRDIILATGPMSLSKYMQLALTSPVGGYYTQGQGIGRTGDFVTSPEISQMFGELMAIWYIMHWQILGKPSNLVLIELGPGRGTLMADMLRTAARFPEFQKSLKAVYFVERSPELRRMQCEKLVGHLQDGPDIEWVDDKNASTKVPKRAKTKQGMEIKWFDLPEEVEFTVDQVPLVMAHEFFDALPIHKFEKALGDKWSEILVDVAESSSTPVDAQSKVNKQHQDLGHFKYVRSRNITANAALVLRDEKYSRLFDKGDMVEVSPESAHIMSQISQWITNQNGLGLVIDYGQDYTQGDTFRGIQEHKFSNPLSAPGSMDLTADVDFSYLRYAAKNKARCFGPVEQGVFLHAMGIQARLEQLLKMTRDTKMQKNLVDCYKRLTDVNSMGRIYKVLAVLPENSNIVPVPFAPPQVSGTAEEALKNKR